MVGQRDAGEFPGLASAGSEEGRGVPVVLPRLVDPPLLVMVVPGRAGRMVEVRCVGGPLDGWRIALSDPPPLVIEAAGVVDEGDRVRYRRHRNDDGDDPPWVYEVCDGW